MSITVPIRKSKNLNIIVMSRIVVIFIALFCYADCMMADSFFIESGIKYKVVDDGHVNVAVQDDSLYSSYAFKDYVLEIPAVVRHDGRSYRVKEIEKFAFTACCAIKHLKIGEGIEAISDYAFQACANLESVSIPSSIKVIGAAPFQYCTCLTTIVVDKTNPMFDSRRGCNAIIKTQENSLIVGCGATKIPSSVRCIDKYAFMGCMAEEVAIPDGVEIISFMAFSSCPNLKKIVIPASVESIEEHAFDNCPEVISIVVDKNNTDYDSRNGCNAIIETSNRKLILGCSSTIIPQGIETIGEFAFSHCRNLQRIVVPEGVLCIADGAFEYCSNLKEVVLPATMETFIGWSNFGYCTSLESINIPKGVCNMESDIFRGCISLQKISVDPANETFDSRNNCNAVIDTEQNRLVAGCKGTVIVDGIKSIASRAFYKSGITSVHIPSSVELIEPAAFKDCEYCMSISVEESNKTYKSAGSNSVVEKATNELVLGCTTTKILPEVKVVGAYAYMNTPSLVILPEGIVSIKEGAFSECKTLQSVILPSSLKSIEELAFYGCRDLAHVALRSKGTEIHKHAFPLDKKFGK